MENIIADVIDIMTDAQLHKLVLHHPQLMENLVVEWRIHEYVQRTDFSCKVKNCGERFETREEFSKHFSTHDGLVTWTQFCCLEE
jgi:hypothetical protein